jgi:hypothetical protein
MQCDHGKVSATIKLFLQQLQVRTTEERCRKETFGKYCLFAPNWNKTFLLWEMKRVNCKGFSTRLSVSRFVSLFTNWIFRWFALQYTHYFSYFDFLYVAVCSSNDNIIQTHTEHTQKNGAVWMVKMLETAPFFCVCPVFIFLIYSYPHYH